MTIIKIEALENGGHDNQTSAGIRRPPEGWAELPEALGTPETLESFPFGDITVDDGGQWPVAASWTPLPVPAPEAEEAEEAEA